MNFLDNLNIKSKLILLLLLPILGFLILSSTQSYNEYKRYATMQKIEYIVVLATKISALVHETQKERGMTAGYLGSKGVKFKDDLPKQRDVSNIKFGDFRNYMNSLNFSLYPKDFKVKLDEVVKKFNSLNEIRTKVNSQSIEASLAIEYYTSMNSLMLDTVVSIAKLSDDEKITKSLIAYSSFLLAKERAGIERAVGANTLSRDSFGSGMREKLNNLISEQNSFLRTFSYYVNRENQEFYKKTLTNKSIAEVERIRNIMLTANEIGGFNTNSEYWFDTITSKINLLKKVEDFIRDNLNITNDNLKIAVNVGSKISNLLHETQKERGATAGFIGSKGSKFVNKLPNQRKNTDERISELKNYLNSININSFSKSFKDNLSASLLSLSKISTMREKVSSLDISTKDAISYYTQMNSEFLETIASVVYMATNSNEVKDLNSFYNFLMSKERAGIERAVLSNSFARNKFLPGMAQKFIVLMTEQNSFIKSFKATAKPEFLKYYNNTLKGESIDEVERMRKVALSTDSIGGFGVSPTYWFEQITNKINMLKKVDDKLANSLIEEVKTIQDDIKSFMTLVLVSSLIAFILVVLIAKVITSKIVDALDTFKEGLGYFFEYAIREKDYLKPMEVKGKDEFAQMTADMNKQIEKTEYIIEQDKKVVLEIDDVMARVKSGFFCYTIKEKGATTEVERLRNNINEMLNVTKLKLDDINKILDAYASGDYQYSLDEIKNNKMNGDIGSLLTSSMLLGTSISQLMAMISNAGEELSSSTHILKESSQNLSKSSNAQAASLEETAAAVEEITSNIRNNSEHVTQMASLADDLNSTAKIGEELATHTASAMDEINQKVTSINEAITVIDQIAFQTNILSLNAAVEAATAGEAGKGFAVVAQEVRNLAARSAEAAKDIKALVEDASLKSQEGKNTSVKMISGYGELNEKVIKTKQMIDSVTISSKEQEEGMIQINDVINNLDQVTQENASTATSIDSLSTEASTLADRLMTITSQASFDEVVKEQVCNIDLVQEIAKYKNDHINFKDVNFNKLDSFEHWTVTDCKSCNLGKWIIATENEGRDFVNSNTWSELKKGHEEVHVYVQDYIDGNANRIDVNELENKACNIEKATYKVFDKLDNLLEVHCKSK